VGGIMTSLFTTGENKVEAIFYGVIMWALVIGLILGITAIGVRTGLSGMTGLVQLTSPVGSAEWEAAARQAGVPADTIADWRRKTQTGVTAAPTEQDHESAAKRLAWFAFGGAWLSMIAAAAGSLLGAGPTFRVVTLSPRSS